MCHLGDWLNDYGELRVDHRTPRHAIHRGQRDVVGATKAQIVNSLKRSQSHEIVRRHDCRRPIRARQEAHCLIICDLATVPAIDD